MGMLLMSDTHIPRRMRCCTKERRKAQDNLAYSCDDY